MSKRKPKVAEEPKVVEARGGATLGPILFEGHCISRTREQAREIRHKALEKAFDEGIEAEVRRALEQAAPPKRPGGGR